MSSGQLDRPLHICLVHGWFPPLHSFGGIVRYLVALVQGYTALGHRVTVVTRSEEAASSETFAGAVVHRVAADPPRSIRQRRIGRAVLDVAASAAYARAIRSIDSRDPIDVVEFTNYAGEGFAHSLRGASLHITRVSTLGWQDAGTVSRARPCDPGRLWRDWYESVALRRSDGLIVPSHAHLRLLGRNYSDLPQVVVVPHGLGREAPAPRERPPSGPVEFLYVGKLDPRKGYDVLIRAFARAHAVLEEKPRLVVAGEDTPHAPENGSFGEFALRDLPADIRSAIEVKGWVPDSALPELYERCDALVAPSRYESFGLMYIEAMRAGRPVVALRAGAAPEIVLDGETGLLADPSSDESLAQQLVILTRDGGLRRRLGNEGRRRWEGRFTEREMCLRSLQAYARLATQR